MARLGVVLAHLGAVLGHLGAVLGHLGAVLGHLGAVLPRLGGIPGSPRATLLDFVLALQRGLTCSAILKPSWPVLGLYWGNLGGSSALLGHLVPETNEKLPYGLCGHPIWPLKS